MEGTQVPLMFSVTTPIGRLDGIFSKHGLKELSLGSKKARSNEVRLLGELSDHRAEQLREYLSVYFSGQDPGMLPLPIDLSGLSDLRKRTYAELSFVGYGVTTTYSELSMRLGMPKGARAVGTAVGANPYLLVIPCHRVLAKGKGGRSALGGFGAGLDVKRRLLALEGHMNDISGL